MKLNLTFSGFSFASGKAEKFGFKCKTIDTLPSRLSRLHPASLIRAETFEDAPLTAPLFQGELPKAEGFFLTFEVSYEPGQRPGL
jgi:hypothetical protein